MRAESDRPVRILHVISSLSPDGAQQMLLKLVSAANPKRFDHRVVSLSERQPGCLDERLVAHGVRVTHLGATGPLFGVAALFRIAREIAQYEPDIVQGWMYHGNLAAQLATATSRRHTAVVWNIRHSADRLPGEKPLTRVIIRLGARLSHLASRVIYCAEVSARQHERLGYRTEATVVIPNGFDTTRFVPNPDARRRLRSALGLSARAQLVGMVGRYHPMKDHHGFLRAATEVARGTADAHFILAGRGIDASNAALTHSVADSGLDGRVHLLGPRDDIADLMAGLDVYCLSSCMHEGFPNVLGEAMSCGIPCVATAVGAAPEIVGPTGVIVPPRAPAALAGAMLHLLRSSSAARRARGEHARARIVARYSLPTVVTQYADLYEAVCRGVTRPCVVSQAS
jgi:glycosyltransferase involved in cell wall biosynthesis